MKGGHAQPSAAFPQRDQHQTASCKIESAPIASNCSPDQQANFLDMDQLLRMCSTVRQLTSCSPTKEVQNIITVIYRIHGLLPVTSSAEHDHAAASSVRPTTFTPMLRQVPTITLQTESKGTSIMSCCLTFAISYTCFAEMVATDWCPGRWLPPSMPAAFFTKYDVGGVLVTCTAIAHQQHFTPDQHSVSMTSLVVSL